MMILKELCDFQMPYASPSSEVTSWQHKSLKGVSLAEVIRHVQC
jgi:hypothetical protein